MELVFVYGTLRKGELYHDLLENSRLCSALAETNGCMADTGLGYPVLLEGSGAERVAGELYEVSGRVLAGLDRLEEYYGPGNPRNEYERIRAEVRTDGGMLEAWVYVYRRPHSYAVIPEGDWKLQRLKRKQDLLYFAYGSCMDLERIEQAGRGESFSRVEGRGVLEGFRMEFTLPLADGGRADLTERGGRTEGKLYRITPECLENYLYAREGVEEGLYRPAVVEVLCEDGTYREAITFVVVNKQEEAAPPVHYMKEILRGAEPVVSPSYYAMLVQCFSEKFNYPFHKMI
ncbi:gamma-glutamylcyclotransferase family protein [Paenibacillus borealis]|uniref:gamma-glutamylcyclotransferase family protein n=1 Tax=Paenibacillus borealis TaxID=160799 RepID=UPI0005A8D140|nr:gamma-glutamylcyclotransferase family protein [Paenibacillus borealis]